MRSRYARLSPVDLSALRIEQPNTPAHIAGLCLLTAGALLDARGALDLKLIKRRLERRLGGSPTLRKIIQPAPPLGGPPLWVDDPQFSINRHVYAVRLAPPGDRATLLRTVELVLRQLLDRSHPLWEIWFFTGLEGGQVGMLVKVHHALADAAAAVALIGALLDLAPDAPDPPAMAWIPAPAPAPRALVRDQLDCRLAALRSTLAHPAQVARSASATLRDSAQLFQRMNAAPRTSLNGRFAEECRICALSLDLKTARIVARTHGAKVNDVVLSVVSGGLRELLSARGEPVVGLELTALVPTTLRTEQTSGQVGNEVGLLLMKLPVGEPDALGRLLRVKMLTKAAKATQHPEYISALLGIGSAFGLARPFLALQRMINIFITDVPGPPLPLYFLGARIEEVLPIIGPGGNVSLMVSAFSYCGRLSLLLDVRASAYPDIEVLIGGINRSWEELRQRTSLTPFTARLEVKRDRSAVL
jgi:diacylglycerol O-acyltransferase / wax synthase